MNNIECEKHAPTPTSELESESKQMQMPRCDVSFDMNEAQEKINNLVKLISQSNPDCKHDFKFEVKCDKVPENSNSTNTESHNQNDLVQRLEYEHDDDHSDRHDTHVNEHINNSDIIY
jgi:hypothetical protein